MKYKICPIQLQEHTKSKVACQYIRLTHHLHTVTSVQNMKKMANIKDLGRELLISSFFQSLWCLPSPPPFHEGPSVSWGVWGFFAFRYWNGKVDLNITSPTLTDVCLYYQESENHFSSSVASPAIGTVVIDVKNISNTLLGWNLYYRPQVSPIQWFTHIKSKHGRNMGRLIEVHTKYYLGFPKPGKTQAMNWSNFSSEELFSRKCKESFVDCMKCTYDFLLPLLLYYIWVILER